MEPKSSPTTAFLLGEQLWNSLQPSDTWEAFNALVSRIAGGVVVYADGPDGRLAYASENLLAMLGYTRAEFDQRYEGRFENLIFPEDRAATLRSIEKQLAERDVDTCTYRMERKDGTPLWVQDEGRTVKDSRGSKWHYVVVTDVSSSVRAKNTLQNRSAELRRMLDSVPVGVVIFRQDAGGIRVAAANRCIERMAHRTATALATMTQSDLLEMVHPDDCVESAQMFQRLFAFGQPEADWVGRIRFYPGSAWRWYRCDAVASLQQDGTLLLYTAYTDVTYQKMQEQEFNRILQELLVTNPNSLCAFRLNLTNNRFSDFHGATAYIRQLLTAQTADELLDRIAAIIPDATDAARFRSRFTLAGMIEAYGRGETRLSATYYRLIDNGEAHWVTTYFNILQNPYTRELEAIAYTVDSDRAHKEEKIVAAITGSEYDYIGLIEPSSGQVYCYYTSREGNAPAGLPSPDYAESIDRLSRLLATPAEQQDYRRALSLNAILRQLDSGDSYLYTYASRSAAGGLRRKQLRFRYLESDRREIMFSRTDVTDAFEHEESYMAQLRQALQEAHRANELKSEFFGNVSHDMRTPLNAILGYARLARQTRDPAEAQNYLEKIDTAGNTLLTLINDTLDLQRMEHGTDELRPEPILCGKVLEDILVSVRPLMENRRIDFQVDARGVTAAAVLADPMALRKILLNLLSNAIKFTPEGGQITLTAACDGQQGDVAHGFIRVQDTGVGISKKFQEKMFEPFAQERTAETAGIGGSGLGLSIVRRLVGQMGGRIEVESRPGEGSAFTVWLDLKLTAPPSVPDSVAPPPAVLKGLHLLLCEDNAMNTEIASHLLRLAGASVDAAADGAEGVRRFEASAPGTYDLILMDLRMPVMDGYAAARAIRASRHAQAASIPILALSADAYADNVENALQSGMNGHLAKPIDPRLLSAEIARLTRKTPGGAGTPPKNA